MKKIIAIIFFVCTFSAANANVESKVNAFIQPFDQSYALSQEYHWYTDVDLTNPTGTFCDIWYEMERLRNRFPGYSFSHQPHARLNDFEYGFYPPYYFATIYSNLP